ncbi:hypothetical protein H1R20_g1519, partial [Candolleomyces eurysporus]
MTQEVSQDAITRDGMQDSRQGEDNTTTSVDHSKAIVDPGSSGWEHDFDRLRAKISTQLKAWEDSQRSSITKQLESFKAQQELQILENICRRDWDELFRECQTLRARERQLTDELSEARLALTRQTLDHQADKVELLEELNAAKSALQLHQIKVLEGKNAAKPAQAKPSEEPSTARTGVAETTAGGNVAKMKKLENDEFDGPEIASDGEAHTEETASQEEFRLQELGLMGPINEGPPDFVVPQLPQAGANDPLQERRRRWETLTWTNQETYNIEGSCSAYLLAGGEPPYTGPSPTATLTCRRLDLPLMQAKTFSCLLVAIGNKVLSRLLVWNWKIGTLIGDTLGTQGHLFGAYEFSFVSPTLFHVTTLANGVGSINLYSINSSSITPAGFTHLASLLLPRVKQGVKIVPVRYTTESLQTNGSPDHLGTSQLNVLQIKYATQFGFFSSEQFQLVVPTSVFIDHWNESQSGTLGRSTTVQWDKWGPSKTRWIPGRPLVPLSLFDSKPENLWTRCQCMWLNGQRVLTLPTEGPGIEVLDFDFDPNSPPVNMDPSLQQEICIDPTVIPAGNVFQNDVVSSLPYIKTTRRGVLKEDFAGFAIDEERIIAISSSITKQLESFKAQQELQILEKIRSEALDTRTRLDNQATELKNALDICRRDWDELFRECQTLRARERQLTDELSEARLALTRQTLDHQADKVELLEELNAAKSALQLHQIKVLEKNAAKSAQVKPSEEPSTARTGLAGMTAAVNVAKMKKLENDESDGPEIASDREDHTEETASQEDLRVQELGRIGPIDEGPPEVVVPQRPQAGAIEPLQKRQRRWQSLTWTKEEIYNIEGPCSAYQLAGGMFSKTDKEGNMLILQLPTSRAPVYRAITHCNLNTKIFGFASDASQELLVSFGYDSRRVLSIYPNALSVKLTG